jgi:hypothetical protein
MVLPDFVGQFIQPMHCKILLQPFWRGVAPAQLAWDKRMLNQFNNTQHHFLFFTAVIRKVLLLLATYPQFHLEIRWLLTSGLWRMPVVG